MTPVVILIVDISKLAYFLPVVLLCSTLPLRTFFSFLRDCVSSKSRHVHFPRGDSDFSRLHQYNQLCPSEQSDVVLVNQRLRNVYHSHQELVRP